MGWVHTLPNNTHIVFRLDAFSLGIDLPTEVCNAMALVVMSNPCPVTWMKGVIDKEMPATVKGQRTAYYRAMLLEAIGAQCPHAMVVVMQRSMDMVPMMAPAVPVLSVRLARLENWIPKACNHDCTEKLHPLHGGQQLWASVRCGGSASMKECLFRACRSGGELNLVTLLEAAVADGLGPRTLFLGEWEASLSLLLAKAVYADVIERPVHMVRPCMPCWPPSPSPELEKRRWGKKLGEYSYAEYMAHVKGHPTCLCDPPSVQALKAALMWFKAERA